MYIGSILLGITVACALFCLVEILVRIWERAERRTNTARPAAPAVSTAARKVVPLYSSGWLPDREAIKNIYSLSDQFADRFREVVNS